jgi:hypothetical protein
MNPYLISAMVVISYGILSCFDIWDYQDEVCEDTGLSGVACKLYGFIS